MSTFYPSGGKQYTLNAGISSTATTITLSSFTVPVTGTLITMAVMNTSIAYGTIQPKTSSAEFISFTGVTQNADGTATLTGVTRGLDKNYPYTSVSGFKLPHSGQSPFILSDAPQLFAKYASTDNANSWADIQTFVVSPIGPVPTTSTQLATKGYVDGIAIAGAPDSSTTVKGIGKLSTAPVSGTNPIFVGDNDTRVPTQGENDALVGNNTDIAVGTGNKFVTQTGLQHNAEKYAADTSASSTAYVVTLSPVPTSYTDGMIVYAKLVNANTTTTPTINVNGLGVKTIVKFVNTALVAGDIAANMFCTFIYDGTNMVLQNPTVPPTSNSFIGAVTSTGTISSTQNVDTVFTPGFGAKTITIHYAISGKDNGTAKSSQGIATFNTTTLTGAINFLENSATTTFGGVAIDASALLAGSLTGSHMQVTLTITSITATQFTIRTAFSTADASNGSAIFYPIAFN